MKKQTHAKPSRLARGGLVLLALAAPAMLACQSLNAPLYFAGPTIEAMGDDEPVAWSGLTLRFRNPTEQEQMQLASQRDALGYDMDVPWISRDKVHIEVSFKVTNTSDQSGTFTVWVDGANEYTKYDVQSTSDALGGDDPIFFPLMWSQPYTLDPGASFSGIVREDDFAEGELDLDALGRWNNADPASPTFAGVLINRSEVNPIGLGLVPPNLVVPALFEVDVHLKTNVAMRCEYFVRVRDDGDRLLHNDGDTLYEPAPALFQPAPLM
jgi:hypothetical protein